MSWKHVSLAGSIVLLSLLLAGGPLPAARAQAASQPNSEVIVAFDELKAYLNGISPRVLPVEQRGSLLAALNTARTHYLDGDICAARTAMNGFLNDSQTYRKAGRVSIAEDLYNRGRRLRGSFDDALVSDPSLPRPGCFDDGWRRPAQVSLGASDNKHLTATLTFGAPRLSTAEAGGETWTEVTLPGLQSQIGEPGLPAVPSWQTLLAIPRGSTPVLVQGALTIRETIKLNVYPFQPQPSDEGGQAQSPPESVEPFLDKPFVKDGRAYSTNAAVPSAPCAVRYLGPMRDLHIVQVQCAAGQYNPVTDELRLFESVEFDVRFQGGDGTFITSQSLNPFEKASAIAIQAVLNSKAVTQYVFPVQSAPLQCSGEELLILTYRYFRAASNALADWKRTKGIATTVIDVGPETPYDTGRKINRLIENRYDTCLTRLSYVLLVGDSDLVPPARTSYDTRQEPDDTTGSDWGYATRSILPDPFGFEGFFPHFAVGRLPVTSSLFAGRVVDKTIRYESAPPFINYFSGAPFYTTATIASYFQCCRMDYPSPVGWVSYTGRDMRGYVENSETVRNTLMGHGHSVQRIYNTSTEAAGSNVWVADATPRRFYDGDTLPPDLAPASGFPWTGSTQDIVDAFNGGRFLIVHRDHGSAGRWWNPHFSYDDVVNLTNDELLPVVYSINCKSGYWDRETNEGEPGESLMERLLTGLDGMVAGIGDNRNTPSGPNSALLRGLIDATWPTLAPEFGGNTPIRRLGDILNHGKLYLATQIGVSQPVSSVTEQNYSDQIILFHAFGDPTLEMWTSNPHSRPLSGTVDITVQADGLVASYPVEGVEITALQVLANGSTRPLARGVVAGGVAQLPFIAQGVGQIDLARVRLSASLSNAVSVPLKVSAVQRNPAIH